MSVVLLHTVLRTARVWYGPHAFESHLNCGARKGAVGMFQRMHVHLNVRRLTLHGQP